MFKIIPGSIVKGTGEGYMYCDTEPTHPASRKLKDRKRRYVYLHRVVMENKLGRLLKKDEQVDHKDGDKANNDPSNLELSVLGPHQKHHAENGNSFWKKSPMNKPGRGKAASDEVILRVVQRYFKNC